MIISKNRKVFRAPQYIVKRAKKVLSLRKIKSCEAFSFLIMILLLDMYVYKMNNYIIIMNKNSTHLSFVLSNKTF